MGKNKKDGNFNNRVERNKKNIEEKQEEEIFLSKKEEKPVVNGKINLFLLACHIEWKEEEN